MLFFLYFLRHERKRDVLIYSIDGVFSICETVEGMLLVTRCRLRRAIVVVEDFLQYFVDATLQQQRNHS